MALSVLNFGRNILTGRLFSNANFSARVSVPFAPPDIISDGDKEIAASDTALKSAKFLEPIIANFIMARE